MGARATETALKKPKLQSDEVVRPFLKWAGGKTSIMPAIRECLAALGPSGRLIEPFVGSGAVFLNTRYDHYVLADSNADLIEVYRLLQEHGDAFIAQCRALFVPQNNTSEQYYPLRAEFNATTDPWRRAALFVYLNRHGYNGLCRYNASGGFNVPFGRYRQPYFPEAEMRAFAQKAQHADFVRTDFRESLMQAQAGDAVYCDPPYVPLSSTASFTQYHTGGFDAQAQADLAHLATALAARGVSVLLSNHDAEITRTLYQGANEIRTLQVRRFISCKGNQRQHAAELLAMYQAYSPSGGSCTSNT